LSSYLPWFWQDTKMKSVTIAANWRILFIVGEVVWIGRLGKVN
jgi:hypothetical protein